MASTLDSIPRNVRFSNLPERVASHKEVESSISDKKIKKIVLSTLKETPLSEYNTLYPLENRLDYVTKKCLDKLKTPDPDQKILIDRIHHFIKTSKVINHETLDGLFLEGDGLHQIDALNSSYELKRLGYFYYNLDCLGDVVYVAKLCEEDIEAFRAKIKKFSRKELIEAIKEAWKNKKDMEIIWTRFSMSTPEQKFHYFTAVCYDSLMKPQYNLLEKNLEKLKTKEFSVEELHKKGLPGSRNMIPDLFEGSAVKESRYKCIAGNISRQFMKKELKHLHKRIENLVRADSKTMKKLGFEVKT